MPTPVTSLIRAATRKPGEPLNILTVPTHEAYETNLAKTGHNFYAWRGQGLKDWNKAYRPLPENYTLLNPERGNNQLPLDVDFDLCLSQNKFGQFQTMQQVARHMHLPLISLEHTLPVPSWHPLQLEEMKRMRGDYNIFISTYSAEKWGWKNEECYIVHHGIDTDLFKPGTEERSPHILSVVNDWINRDWCCGFRIWQEVTRGLPALPVGDTPGLSKPAPSTADLVREYQRAQVFINTSTVSPIPTALLEAMACGCAVVSTDNCMIPEIITNGVNGYLTNDPSKMRAYLLELIKNPTKARKLGEAARQTILDRFSLESFVENWKSVFEAASKVVWR